ncbi:MAG: class I SAM-dependent methyltransferase [Pyrinomonadaceae bacterium]
MIEVGRTTHPQPTLAERLRARIRREGPITFRDWMEAALYDPEGGYYRRADLTRWGRAGDYRTSPERSPLFAATLARYFASRFDELGAPAQFKIIEAGAGDGQFARGVCETLRRDFPHVLASLRYLIDEPSEDSRRRIERNLSAFTGLYEFIRIDQPGGPLGEGIVFSNELLDALPVHRIRWRGGKLWELRVGLNQAGAFAWREREPSTPRLAEYVEHEAITLAEGQSAEVNFAAGEWLARAASILTCGYVVTVDYGAEAAELYHARQRPDGTLRAFRNHQIVDDVLARPGEQDLTTTIDWTHIRRAGESVGLRPVSFARQDQFLLRAGLLEQLELLTTHAPSEAEALALRLAARDLLLPGGMGQSFQVLVQRKDP